MTPKNTNSLKVYKCGELILDRYIVQTRIESGGMGIVYLCEVEENEMEKGKEKIHKLVAIKTLSPSVFESEQDVKDFENEALNWIRLDNHFNVVKVLDVELLDYYPAIIMEGIPFNYNHNINNLYGYLEKENISVIEGVKFAIQLCDAIMWVSEKYKEQGKVFIHRDLKPRNIMITPSRRLKLTDFGISDIGFIGGTTGYMSPEQIKKETLDERSDIYSFGCIFYEVFCEKQSLFKVRKPFDDNEQKRKSGNFLDKIFSKFKASPENDSNSKDEKEKEKELKRKHLSERIIDPKQFVKKSVVSKQIRKILIQCLQKDKTKRPQNFKVLRKRFADLFKVLTTEEYPSIGGKELNFLEFQSKGESLYFLRKYSESLKYFEEALQHFKPYSFYPHPIDVWNKIGLALNRLKRTDEAFEYFEKCLSIDSQDISTLINKGVLLKGLKKFKKELECYEQVLKIESNNLIALFNKANVFYSMGEFEEAIIHHKRVLELEPNHAEAWCDMGLAHLKLKQFDVSLKCYDTAYKLNDRDELTLIGIAGVYKEIGNIKEAYRFYEKSLEINPEQSLPWLDVGVIFSELNRHEEAIELYKQALTKENPAYVKIYSNLGTAFGMLKRDKEALEAFKKALEIDPEYLTALQNIGTALIKLNRDEEAIKYLERALKIDPKKKLTNFNIGECYLGLEKYSEAILWYKKTLEIDSEFQLATKRINAINEFLN